MSRVVDERVVSMQFDNKQFESNVATSMGTLEKLKRSLNLSGASKGLENVNTAARKCNLSPLSNAAETVGLKFNAMYTIADQSLRNMVNSAMSAGKKIASAFTIDPIKTGFQEYETQINSVQTILANTESKGSTLDDVNAALDELNTYADKTIYNFTEMTRNIGTFTAAGVDLDKSVTSIKGIANLAAVSGSTSQQASTAMYQLSQALASGTVKLMDWNSVVNAGMGGEVFQTALKRTATQMGYNVDAMIEKYGSFRESLTQGEWLTAEVLTETLTQLSGAYTEADLIAQGYSESQAAEIAKLADTAVNAATKVKTFTQLMDTLKEAAQSGWTQTWELIVGDFEQAKAMWTGVSDTFGEIINSMSESRNEVLGGALKSNWEKLVDGLAEAGVSSTEFEDRLRSLMEADGRDVDKLLATYGSFEEVFRSGAVSSKWLKDALDSLTESVSDLSGVEAGLAKGDTSEHVKKVQQALMDMGFDMDKYGADGIFGRVTEDAVKAFQELEGLEVTGIVDEATLKALEEATSSSIELKDSLYDLVDGIDKLGGREKLLNAFKNIWTAIVTPIKAVGEAWNNVFGMSAEDKSAKLFGLIEGFESFTEKLIISGDSAEKIASIFSGLFSAIKIGAGFVGGGFKMAFTALSAVLENFDMNILDVLAAIGDFFTKAYKWVDENNIIGESIMFVAGMLMLGVEKIREWYNAFLAIPGVQEKITAIRDAFAGIGDYIGGGVKKIQEFWESLKGPNWKLFFDDGELGKAFRTALFDNFKNNVLGYFSNIGEKISEFVAKIIAPLSQLRDSAGEYLSATGDKFITFKNKISEFFNGIKDWVGDNKGAIASFGSLLTLIILLAKIKKGVSKIAGVFKSFGGIGESISEFIDSFAKLNNAKAQAIKMDAISDLIKSIALLAGTVALLAMIPEDKLWTAVKVMGVLAGGVLFMVLALKFINKIPSKGETDLVQFGKLMSKLGWALLLMTASIKILGGMDPGELKQGGLAVAAFMGMVILMMAATKFIDDKNMNEFAKMIRKLSVALLILSGVVYILGSMDHDVLKQGGFAVGVFLLAMAGMMQATRGMDKNVSKFGSMMLKLGFALLLMSAAIKVLGGMDIHTLTQGGLAIGVFLVVMIGMMKYTQSIGKSADKFGKMMAGIGVSLLLMAIAIKILGGMDVASIVKGGLAIMALMGVMTIMMAATRLLGKNSTNAAKFGLMMLSFAGAIVIMTGAIALLGMIEQDNIDKAIGAIGKLSLMFGVLMLVSKFKGDLSGIIGMSIAIGILAASIAGLSFVPEESLKSATTALVVIMGMFAILVKSTKVMPKAMGTLIAMSGAIMLLAGILILFDYLEVDNALKNAAAISLLLLTMSAALAVAGKLGTTAMKGVGALAVMGLVVAELAVILGLMSKFNVEPSIETAKSLSILLLAMSGALVACGLVGLMGPAPFIGIAALAVFIAAVGGLIIGIGALVDKFPTLETFLDKGIPVLEKIGHGLGSFFGNIVSGFASGLSDGLPDIATNLSDFMTKLQPFLDGVKGIDESMTAGMGNLVDIILKLTAANILDAIGSWLTGGSSLADFAEQLIPFGAALVIFGNTISLLSDDAVTKITTVADATKALVEIAESVPETGGLKQKITGVPDLTAFAYGLVDLGGAVKIFAASVSGITDDNISIMSKISDVISKLAEIANNVPETGGWAQKIEGIPDMVSFATGLESLGGAVKSFTASVAEVTDDDITKMTSISTVIDKFTEIAAKVPETGGLQQAITGTPDLVTFATGLIGIGVAVQSLSTSISTMTDEDIAKMTSISTVIDKFTEIANKVPETGGLQQAITGTPDLVSFAMSLIPLGGAIALFTLATSSINIEDVVKMASIGVAIDKFTDIANKVPPQDGLLAAIEGTPSLTEFAGELITFAQKLKTFAAEIVDLSDDDIGKMTKIGEAAKTLVGVAASLKDYDDSEWFNTNLTEFAGELSNFGTKMSEYSSSVADIDTSKITTVVMTARSMLNLARDLNDADTTTLSDFGDNIGWFGEGFKSMSNDLADVDVSKISSAITQVNRLVTLGDSMSSLSGKDFSGFSSFGESLGAVGAEAVDKFAGAIENAGPKVQAAATTMVTMLKAGLTSGMTQLPSVLNANITYAVAAIKGKWSSFYDAGKFLVSGFASGISVNAFRAAAAAKAMADSAYQAAKSALDINSPSKIFRSLGTSVPEGFAMGIGMLGSMVKKSSVSMADTAIDSTKNAISRIADVINSDIDAQPTIRPVVDLSDVRSGANAIGGMFGINPSVGVLSNVGTINSMMNARVQNGVNSDVISAINDLGKKLGNSTGDTYNVNGVTYDDGSNIVDAVKTLVRAAKVERRI